MAKIKEPETPETKEPDVFVAISSGTVLVKGKRCNYSRGLTIVRAGDPLLLAVPTRFRPLTESRHIAVPERA